MAERLQQFMAICKRVNTLATYVFPPGLRTAIHVHSYPYDGVIVKGAARHFQPASEAQAVWLMPGSFYRVPGNVAHISECSEASECIFAIHQHDAFDRALVE